MPPKLSKKQKKAQEFRQKQKDKALSEENAVPEVDIVDEQSESSPIDEKKRKAEEQEDVAEKRPAKKNRRPKKKTAEEKKNRFILFVGNLAYDTTGDNLAKHFESVGELPSVRLMTDKQTKKPKGFAFIEFKDSRNLSKALAFHHTFFNKRQINVELTAGGGGRSDARKEKLKEKNEKLQQDRQKWHKDKVVGADPASSYQKQHQEE
ncbi:hypothetical protein BJV82DRAFT_668857 [Fennellomyces sp. T-0311]|nr:hypothetical protein BJV82DRAFT_668857 [Fennellomyces sp. T-0311]